MPWGARLLVTSGASFVRLCIRMSSMDDEQMVSVGGIASSESNDGVRRSASVSSDPVQARSFAAVAHSQHQHHLLPASRGPNNRHRSLTLDTPPVVNANLVRQSFMPAFSLPQSTNTSAVPSPHSKPQPAIPPFHFQLPKDTAQRLVRVFTRALARRFLSRWL